MKNKEDLEQLKIIEKDNYQESNNFSEENPVYQEHQYFPFDNKQADEFATDKVFIEQNNNQSADKTSFSDRISKTEAISSKVSSALTSVSIAVVAVVVIVATTILMSGFPLKYQVEYQILAEFIEFSINVEGEEGYQSFAHLYNNDLEFDISYPLEYGENFVSFYHIEKGARYYFEIVCIKQDSEDKRIFEKLTIDIPEEECFEIGFIEAFEYGMECMVIVNSPFENGNYVVLRGPDEDEKREYLHPGENMVCFERLFPDTEYVLEFFTYDINTREEVIAKTLKVKTRQEDYFE